MAAWRTLAGALALLAVAGAGRTETYPLAEEVKAGDCFKLALDMTLRGELRFQQDGKVVPIKLEAGAAHDLSQRVLNVGANALAARAAQVYHKASATIHAGDNRIEKTLRKERTLMVAQRHQDRHLVYCPAGPMTRSELELTGEHFDTLFLTGLLPGKAVAVGDTWKVNNAVAQALCGFEGLTEQDLSCKLEEVKDKVARVSVRGTAGGIDLGALVKLDLRGSYRFDLEAKRLTALEWTQKDERDQGPASPASAIEVTSKVTRTAVEQPDCLDDVDLVPVPDGFEPPEVMTMVSHPDPKGRYNLTHGRDWQIVSQTDEHLVLRLMERGDFVAQATLTPWKAAEKGKRLTPEEFKQAMTRTPGWEPERELQAEEVQDKTKDGGHYVYRLVMQGTLDGTEVVQNFYLIANAAGEQVVLLFTMTPKKAEKLGTRDLMMATGLEIPGGSK